MKTHLLIFFFFLPFALLSVEHPYTDATHSSVTFSKEKTYRVYLPSNYDRSSERYPVIYFFHGWGGRYFKDDSANMAYDLLGQVVNNHQCILVMWDGNMDESEPRPYNVGNHEDVKFQVQIKDYFPELVTHIDSTYRTLNDRRHRGIIGFSMGGFLAAFLAGKYPDRVSAIVNMVGSPEFFVGYPDNHTLYPIRYTFDNLNDVALCFHTMDNCPLFYFSTEINNAARWKGLTNYTYWQGEGDHKIDEPDQTIVFDRAVRFLLNSFNHPVERVSRWSHSDVYSSFDLWGYQVRTNKSHPGFISLTHVSPSGFGFHSRKWMPDGPAFPVQASVLTAPLYKKGISYNIIIYNRYGAKSSSYVQKADNRGQLRIDTLESESEVVISEKKLPSDFVIVRHTLNSESGQMLRPNVANSLTLEILRRGYEYEPQGELAVSVTCLDSLITIKNGIQKVRFDRGNRFLQTDSIEVTVSGSPPCDASPYMARLAVRFAYAGTEETDEVLIPIYYDVPPFKYIKIDDGIGIRSAPHGTGDANGVASPSERIMLYHNYQPLRLFTDDPYVERCAEELFHDMLPFGIWPDGYTSSSIVKIADNCPDGHVVEFLASYETRTFMPIQRKMVWGKVRITVKKQ